MEQECGIRFGYRLEVHEESATAIHMILPPASRLSRIDLQAVAGGDYSAGDPWAGFRG